MNDVPAGWYQQEDGRERFWSGSAWTDHDRQSASRPGALVPATPRPVEAYAVPTNAVRAPTVAAKSPGLALLASFFLPGLGQLINGDAAKGILMLLGYFFSFILMFVVVGFFTAFAIWVWAMVDAYQGAQRWNLQRGIIS